MHDKSSNSVRVIFADKDAVLRQVTEYTRRLKRARPEVKKVGLFGSYANDTYVPASDVDLLIVLRQSDKTFLDRIPDYIPDNLDVCCDVFPYTQQEIETMKQKRNRWIEHILREAVWL